MIRRLPAPSPATVVALVAAAGVLTAGVVYGSSAAGGSDSYGYVSQAELWLTGDLIVHQPWMDEVPWPSARQTFVPLGYRPSDVVPDAIVPTYPPGLPLLMALAKGLFGQPGIFWVVPLCGAILTLATYGLGRRIGSPAVGASAACLVATSPVVLYNLTIPMSDIPAAAAWMACFWAMAGRSLRGSAAAGLALSVAVLIRPNLGPLALLPAAWFVLQWRRDGESRAGLARGAAFAVGLAPGVLAVAALNARLYGSPLVSGYGDLGVLFAWDHVGPNVRQYLAWFVEMQTMWLLIGIPTLVVPLRRIWPATADRGLVLTFGAFVVALWSLYCLYLVFETWWYLRFLLPALPLIGVGFSQVLWQTARRWPSWVRIGPIVIVCLLATRGATVAVDQWAFSWWYGESKYPGAARVVQQYTEDNAVVMAMQHSGSVRYYAGRLTLRFDELDPEWLDPAILWFKERGVHAYLLVDQSEEELFRSRFADVSPLGGLAMEPLVTYAGGARVNLYDLWAPPARAVAIDESFDGLRYARPAPQPFPALRAGEAATAGAVDVPPAAP